MDPCNTHQRQYHVVVLRLDRQHGAAFGVGGTETIGPARDDHVMEPERPVAEPRPRSRPGLVAIERRRHGVRRS